MTKLIATESLRYAGCELVIDQEFDASDDDAHVLKLIGKATDAPSSNLPKSGSQKIHTSALSPEGGDQPPDGAQRRGRYRRADMRPEE